MLEILIEFREFFEQIGSLLLRGGITFVPSLAVVYIIGRMLSITNSDRIKNFIALLCIFGISFLYNYVYRPEPDIMKFVSQVLMDGSIGVLQYVLIGFRLFNRMDSLLDKKIGKDQGYKPTKRKKKKSS